MRDRVRHEQGGYAIPFLALSLTVLLAFAGLGVDFWQWWHTAQRVQRAADAGALAGVVYVPGDPPTARTTAVNAVASNGHAAGSTTVYTSTDDNSLKPNQLRVEVTQTVRNAFLGLIGLHSTTVTRDAIAEYSGSVPMGSPINQIGGQPLGAGDSEWPGASDDDEAKDPDVWAQIAGDENSKENGDRFAAGNCSNGNHGCSGGTNTEHADFDGYWYNLRTTFTSTSQRLLIEIYDPAFVQQGDNCTDFRDSSTRTNIDAMGASDPRYDLDNLNYCPGDHTSTGSHQDYNTGYQTTTFQVRAPDDTPWSYRDNPVVNISGRCSAQPGGQYGVGGNTGTFRPYGSAAGESAANLDNHVATPGTYARTVFHRWVRVCEVSLADVGITTTGVHDFVLNVNSCCDGQRGHNRYAIRAARVDSGGGNLNGSAVSVYALEHLPLYQNETASTAAFFLARVTPNAASRALQVEFFDVGDGSGSGSIEILPPDDAESNLSSFTGCTFSLTGGSSPSYSGCTLNGVASGAGYNGQRVQAVVPIPSNYDCQESSPVGCWIRVRFHWSGAIQDTTTWSAALLGDPVRLVE